jgi:lipoprotein Spr
MTADLIAFRANAQLNTPFRFRGRTPGVALDCVGLVLTALGPIAETTVDCPSYSLRGDFRRAISSGFAQLPFHLISESEPGRDGDIILASAGPSQLHLMVAANSGWVHAHAGLGRVVFTPLWPGWPIIHRWRLIGD